MRVTFISSVTLLCFSLIGCASTATIAKKNALDSSNVAYGRITKVRDADNGGNRRYCDSLKGDAASVGVCSNLSAHDEATATVFHSARLFSFGVAVPKTERIMVGNIIQFNPQNNAGSFVRVATREENDSCKWVGPTPEQLNSGSAMAAGFLAGMLIVPTIIVAANDQILEGGVVCDGWSYKTIISKSNGNMD